MVVQDRAGRASPPTGLARSGLRCDRRHGGGACLFPAAIRLSPEPDLERYHIRPGSGLCLSPSKLTSCPRCNYTLPRSEEHTSELQSLMRISSAVFCLKKKNKKN